MGLHPRLGRGDLTMLCRPPELLRFDSPERDRGGSTAARVPLSLQHVRKHDD